MQELIKTRGFYKAEYLEVQRIIGKANNELIGISIRKYKGDKSSTYISTQLGTIKVSNPLAKLTLKGILESFSVQQQTIEEVMEYLYA